MASTSTLYFNREKHKIFFIESVCKQIIGRNCTQINKYYVNFFFFNFREVNFNLYENTKLVIL